MNSENQDHQEVNNKQVNGHFSSPLLPPSISTIEGKEEEEKWFSEIGTLNGNHFRVSVKIDSIVQSTKSAFQHLLVLDTTTFGRTLILDNAIQCTQRDEFAYQEMMAWIPLGLHPCPKSVLIIGGGDGGVAREVLRHPDVQHVTQVEIDQHVIDVSRAHLPWMSRGAFDDPRMKLIVDDGIQFLESSSKEEKFDVIITDSSDPIGPAVVLFQSRYYELLDSVLEPSFGIICSQSENFWFEFETVKNLIRVARGVFGHAHYGSISIPSYPSGQIGFLVAGHALNQPRVIVNERQFGDQGKNDNGASSEVIEWKYYSREMHSASFVLPTFVTKELEKI